MQGKIETIFPLTSVQFGMLLESVSMPGQGLHVEQALFDLIGTVDPEALRGAFDRALARHQILRAAFAWKTQTYPQHVIARSVEMPFLIEDVSQLEPLEQLERVKASADEDRCRGFELSEPPCMRATLFLMGRQRSTLVWTHHHILMDGWSATRVAYEVLTEFAGVECFASLDSDRVFSAYVSWMRTQNAQEAQAFWTGFLKGASDLPRALAVPHQGVDADGEIAICLTNAQATALRDCAAQHRVTPSAVTQAAWGLLLSYLGDSERVCFGVTLSHRPPSIPGIEDGVGLFMNTLPILISTRPDLTSAAWVSEVQTSFHEIYQHAHCSGAQIHGWSGVDANELLYTSILVYQNYPATPDLGNQRLRIRKRHQTARTRFPIVLIVSDGDPFQLRAIYRRLYIDDDEATALVQALAVMLTAFPKTARQSVSQWRDLLDSQKGLTSLNRSIAYAATTGEKGSDSALRRFWKNTFRPHHARGPSKSRIPIGGHSLMVAELVARLNKEDDSDLTLGSVLASLEDIAEATSPGVVYSAATKRPPVEKRGSTQDHLSFAQLDWRDELSTNQRVSRAGALLSKLRIKRASVTDDTALDSAVPPVLGVFQVTDGISTRSIFDRFRGICELNPIMRTAFADTRLMLSPQVRPVGEVATDFDDDDSHKDVSAWVKNLKSKFANVIFPAGRPAIKLLYNQNVGGFVILAHPALLDLPSIALMAQFLDQDGQRPASVNHSDLAHWQTERDSAGDFDKTYAYWSERAALMDWRPFLTDKERVIQTGSQVVATLHGQQHRVETELLQAAALIAQSLLQPDEMSLGITLPARLSRELRDVIGPLSHMLALSIRAKHIGEPNVFAAKLAAALRDPAVTIGAVRRKFPSTLGKHVAAPQVHIAIYDFDETATSAFQIFDAQGPPRAEFDVEIIRFPDRIQLSMRSARTTGERLAPREMCDLFRDSLDAIVA